MIDADSPFDPDLLKELVRVELARDAGKEDALKRKGLSKLSLGALLAANAGDALTTIFRAPGTHELNPAYGKQPSAGKVLAIKGAGTVAQVLALRKLGQSHPKVADGLAKVVSGVLGAVAIKNARQGRK